jgi:transcriptional regulator with XRE-family HTH domain
VWLAYGLGEKQTDETAANCEGMDARLQAVREAQSQTKVTIARLAGLTAPSIAQIESEGQARVENIEAPANCLNVSPAWPAYGLGPQALPSRRRQHAIQTEIVLE